MPFEKIAVIGLGYIGLPTAAMFASKNKKVIGVDVNQHVVNTINSGKIHIVEPELDTMVKKAVDDGFLKASVSMDPADVFIIAVPTPFLSVQNKGQVPEPDLSYVKSASKSVAKVLKKGDLVILESTCPVGTTEQMSAWLAEERTDLSFPQTHGEESDIRIAHCPERVLPGSVIRELVTNDRVIGGLTKKCSEASLDLYRIFLEGDCAVTNARTAEMAKLTENASRDVSIAFANELSVISDELDIDVWELISIANLHPRVNILQPGPGVGGHCIAVDPWFIISKNPRESRLMQAAREVNDSKPNWVIKKLKLMLNKFISENSDANPHDIKVACYGLTFKADVDDLRQSPSMQIVRDLLAFHKGPVFSVDPNIKALPKEIKGSSLLDYETAIAIADIHILLVDHKEFKEKAVKSDYVIDTRGIW